MTKGTPELVKHWIAEGYSNKAVAAYGTSVSFFERALKSGEIPFNVAYFNHNLLDYQRKLLERGGYLYYAYPFLENLEPYKPSFVRKMRRIPNEDFSYEAMRRQLRNYAGRHAIPHHFESLTGIRLDEPDEVVSLAYLLFPDLVSKYRDDSTLKDAFYYFTANADWKKPPPLSFNRPNMTLSELRNILAQSIARRGLIIYYNEKVLANELKEGFELEAEIMIHTKKPLTLEVIAGIEPLAEPDKQAVSDLIMTLESKKS